MNSHDDFDVLGFNDPMKMKAITAQMSSVRDMVAYSEYQEKQKAALAARNKAQADAQREKDRIDEMRYEASERAMKERERIDLIRYHENRRLSLIAIWVSVASTILAAIAIFK